jgi:hypothetical protein
LLKLEFFFFAVAWTKEFWQLELGPHINDWGSREAHHCFSSFTQVNA